ARTPPKRAKARVGSAEAACTSATMSGDGAIRVISQAAPTDCTHCPKLADSVPIHTARNMPKRKGDSAVGARRDDLGVVAMKSAIVQFHRASFETRLSALLRMRMIDHGK